MELARELADWLALPGGVSLLGPILAFAITVLACQLLMPIAPTLGLVDCPDRGRKGHARPTPRCGGLAIVLGLLVTVLLIQPALFAALPTPSWLALMVLFSLGLLDDGRGLTARQKLPVQVLVAFVLAYSHHLDHLCLFGQELQLGPLAVPATVAWLLLCMNAWNLIDGADGLAGGLGLVACLALATLASAAGYSDTLSLLVMLAGGLAGFLLLNRPPARLFLGDAGSLLLGTGFGLAAMHVATEPSTSALSVTGLLLIHWVPLLDTGLAFFRRWLRGVTWAAPDRDHLHHRLQAHGYSTARMVLTLCGLALACQGAVLAGRRLNTDLLAWALAGAATLLALRPILPVGRRFEIFRRHLIQRFAERRHRVAIACAIWESITAARRANSVAEILEITRQLSHHLGFQTVAIEFAREGDRLLSWQARVADLNAFRQSGAAEERTQLSVVVGDWPGETLQVRWTAALADHRAALAGPQLPTYVRQILAVLRALDAESPATPWPAPTKAPRAVSYRYPVETPA